MDNLLQPLLVGGKARLPVLPLFLVSFGGLAYFGFLGLFLGPVLLAVVLVMFVIYQEEYQQQASDMLIGVPTDPRGVAGLTMETGTQAKSTTWLGAYQEPTRRTERH
jgi:hypothetical protein